MRSTTWLMIILAGTVAMNSGSAWAFKAPDEPRVAADGDQGRNLYRDGMRTMRRLDLADLDDPASPGSVGSRGRTLTGTIENAALRLVNRGLKSGGSEMRITSVQTDKLGNRHLRMMQYYRGIAVIGADIALHIDKTNRVYAVTGDIAPALDAGTTASIDLKEAVRNARLNVSDSAARADSSGRQVIFDNRLAYEVVVHGTTDGGPQSWRCYVDAQTGGVLLRIDQILHAAPGTLGSHKPIDGYRLADEDGTLVSMDGWRDSLGNYFMYNRDAKWCVYNTDLYDYEQRATPSWGTSDRAAVSLGRNIATVQQYVSTVLGRSSFDNLGAMAVANVHEGSAYVNAYWNGSQFYFGDGDGSTAGPLTVLDIAAHEYGHALTQYTSNLVYSYESGALNESYSDILGTMVEFWTQPDGRSFYPSSSAGRADWLCGEDCWISGDALRDLRNPLRYGNPSYYLGTSWYTGSGDNGGVHYNSGVQNFAFYLLAEGGTGTNDGHPYAISGMGVDRAGEIAMYADMYLLTSGSQYSDARNAWILAAQTLGYDAATVGAVWTACGVMPRAKYLRVTPALLAFDSVGVNVADTMRVALTNDALDATTVTSVTINNPDFTVSPATPFMVPGGGVYQLPIVYRPSATGRDTATVTIISNAEDNPVLAVRLDGIGVLPAQASITPSYITATTAVGDSVVRYVTIKNSGQATLDYRIAVIDNGLSMTPAVAPVYGQSHFLPLRKGETDTRQGYAVTQAAGGPDSGGYRWKDSRETGGPRFVWEDISTTGSLLGTVSGCDDCSEPVAISFPFTWYGQTFETVYVSSNGHLTFGAGSSLYGNYPLPSSSMPGNLIAMLFDDLNPGSGGDIYVRDFGDRLVLQYQNVIPYGGGSGTYTFQAVLYPSGTVRVYFKSMTGVLTSATTGIQNSTRSIGLTVAYNTAFIQDSLALEFSKNPRWLRAQPISGLVGMNDSAQVRVTLDASALYGGRHAGRLDISHNDPLRISPVPVMCTLMVDGMRRLAAQPDSLAFGSIWAGVGDTAFITLANNGDEATTIDSIRTTGMFAVQSAGPMIIPAMTTVAVGVVFAPTVPGDARGVLTIVSDAEDNPRIDVALYGIATTPPGIDVTPGRFSVPVNSGATVARTMRIGNNGGDTLLVTIANPARGSIVINEFSNEPDFIELWNRGGDQRMDGWRLILDDNAGSSGTFTFPTGFILRAGKRVVLRENTGTANDSTFYYGVNIGWIEGSSVALSLLDGAGTGVDFVRTAASTITPPTGTTWNGGGVGFTLYDAARRGNTDLNDTADWTVSYTPSECILNPGQSAFSVAGGWLTISPIVARVSPGDSADVTLGFNAAGLQGGTYNDTVRITHNAPASANPQLVPVEMIVAGFRSLAVRPQAIDLGSVRVGGCDTAFLRLVNNGSETTLFAGLGSSKPEFRLMEPLPLSVAAFDSVSVRVVFTPVVPGPDSAQITIASNAQDSPVLYASIRGVGAPSPYISLSANGITRSVAVGGIASGGFTVSNTGGDSLRYSMRLTGAGNGDSIHILAWVPYTDMSGEYVNTIAAIDRYTDRFQVTNSTTVDSAVLEQELGGKEVWLVMEQENGTIASGTGTRFRGVLDRFLRRGGIIIYCCPGYMGNTTEFLNQAGLMNLSNAGSAYSGEAVNVNIPTHPLFDSLQGTLTMQDATNYCTVNDSSSVLATYNGYMVVAEKRIHQGRVITIGLDFYAYTDPWARVISNAVKLAKTTPVWVQLAGASNGVVAQGSQIPVLLTFDASRLTAGQYTASLFLSHDAINRENPIMLPVTLNVGATSGDVSHVLFIGPAAEVELRGGYYTAGGIGVGSAATGKVSGGVYSGWLW